MMQEPLNAVRHWWTDERLPTTHQQQSQMMMGQPTPQQTMGMGWRFGVIVDSSEITARHD